MSQASSVANAGFRSVRSLAGQLSNVSVSEARMSKASAVDLTVTDLNNDLYIRSVAVGYAPVGFATAAIGAVLPLNVTRDTALATGTAGSAILPSELLQLPSESVVTGIRVTNNGVVITGGAGATVDIGFAVNTWPVASITTTLLAANAAVAITDPINDTGLYAASAASAVGSAGTGIVSDTSTVCVQVLVAALTAGDLKVELEYFYPA